MYVYTHSMFVRPEELIRVPGAGVIGGYKPLDAGVGSWSLSSGRASNALNRWVISPDTRNHFKICA